MSKQAKYLIDDARYHITVLATSWDYDNRVTSDKDDVFPKTLTDNASGHGIRIKRDFQTQTTGNLCLELFYKTELCADGVSVKICSSDETPIFELSTHNGFFYFCGKKQIPEQKKDLQD